MHSYARAATGRHGPGVVGTGQPFKQHTLQHRWRALAAIVGRARQRRPAGLPKVWASRKTCGVCTRPLSAAAFLIAAALQRGDGAVHKLGRLSSTWAARSSSVSANGARPATRGRLQHGGQQVLDVGKGLAGFAWFALF